MSLSSSSSRASRLGALAAVAFGLASLGLASQGCYNPKISEKLKCNKEYAAGAGECPDGYHCSTAGLCLKGPVPKDGGTPDMGPVDRPPGDPLPTEVPPVDMGPDVPPVCVQPVQGCTSGAGMCDPVCQTGCGCHEKCEANTATGALVCSVPIPGRPRVVGEGCNPFAPGTATQSDDCMPGLVCLADGCGTRCYKYCKTDGDCPMSTCTHEAGGGVKTCDVPTVACNPITNNGMPDGCGSAGDTLTCWLSTAGTDQTFCDCPGPDSIGRPNTACTATRDCFPGLVCVGSGTPLCRQVCSLTNGSADCQGGTCTAINNNKKFGFCN